MSRCLNYHPTIYTLLGNLPWLSNADAGRPQQARASAPVCSLPVLSLPVTFVFWLHPACRQEWARAAASSLPWMVWRFTLGTLALKGVLTQIAKSSSQSWKELAQMFLRPPEVVMQNIYVCTASNYPLGEKHEWSREIIRDITLLNYCEHCIKSVQTLE